MKKMLSFVLTLALLLSSSAVSGLVANAAVTYTEKVYGDTGTLETVTLSSDDYIRIISDTSIAITDVDKTYSITQACVVYATAQFNNADQHPGPLSPTPMSLNYELKLGSDWHDTCTPTSANGGDYEYCSMEITDTMITEAGGTYTLAFNVRAEKFPKVPISELGQKMAYAAVTAYAPAVHHNWGAGVVTTPATCTTDGVMTYTCSDCSATKTEVIPAIGHNWGSWSDCGDGTHMRTCRNDPSHKQTASHTWDAGVVTTPATCTTDGVMTYTCSDCSATKTEAVPAAHDWVYVDNIDGTHTATCSVCSETKTEAHNWNDGVVTTPATCTETGVMTYTCVDCGATKEDAVPALGHDWGEWQDTGDGANHIRVCANDASHTETAPHNWDDGVETLSPTCTTDGVWTYTCTDCGATYTEPIPALGHDWGPWVDIGSDTDHARYCLNDQSEFETELHNWNYGVMTLEPTCTEDGVITYTCLDCGATYTSSFPALGHSWGPWENGGDDADYHIRYCNNNPNESETAPHNWGSGVETLAPTCTEDGEMTYNCTDCGAAKTEPIPALGHTWTYVDNKDGTHTASCSVCNETKTESHTWDSGVVTTAAACTTDGVMTYTCILCGAVKTEVIPATGHNWGPWTEGTDDHFRRCLNDPDEIQSEGHTYDDGVVTLEPTCTTAGIMTYTCTACGHKMTVGIDPIGHNWGPWTDTGSGYDHIRVCANDASHTETAAHTWDGGVVTKEAGCVEAGEITYTCTVCGAKRVEMIEPTGHSDMNGDGICDNCGEALGKNIGMGNWFDALIRLIKAVSLMLQSMYLIYITLAQN